MKDLKESELALIVQLSVLKKYMLILKGRSLWEGTRIYLNLSVVTNLSL